MLKYYEYKKNKTLANGTVYYNPHTCRKFALVYIEEHKYGIMYVGEGLHTIFQPSFQFDKEGNFMFTLNELKDKFHAEDWEELNECVNIVNLSKAWETRAV